VKDVVSETKSLLHAMEEYLANVKLERIWEQAVMA